MTTEFATLTAIELLEGYRRRAFSPVEVVKAQLDLAQALNPRLNAFYFFDPDHTLQAARESEARWGRGTPCGPLDGVPSSSKDALISKGWPTYRGSGAHPDQTVWDYDVPSIARMREAGAIFLGKTTMPDFGILPGSTSSEYGATRNPWNLAKTPGGSTAGGAATIAAGINPIVIGTDIVGSIRLPASFTGIFGHKPSYGRVPYYFPNSPALVAGPMARTVADAALLMNVLVQPDSRDHTALAPDGTDYLGLLGKTPDRSLRIGFVESLGFGLKVDSEVEALVRAAVDGLAAQGFDVRPVKAGFTREDLRAAERFYKVRTRTELTSMPREVQARAPVLGAWSAEADGVSAIEFYRLFLELQKMRERTLMLFEGCDFIVLPAVHVPAFDADKPGADAASPFDAYAYCFLFNLSEQPASSLPCGLTGEGLPVGLQIVGRRYDDAGVFRLSDFMARHVVPALPIASMISRLKDSS